jgi:hypothetical protein
MTLTSVGSGLASRERRRSAGVDEASRRLLQYLVVPLWIGAGLGDWICHRRTSIETTSGVKESAIHALMMAEAGVPATLGLFLEINAGVLAATIGAFAAHQATAIWDVAYADDRRRVTPTEQHIHGLLEQVPAMARHTLSRCTGIRRARCCGSGKTGRWSASSASAGLYIARVSRRAARGRDGTGGTAIR